MARCGRARFSSARSIKAIPPGVDIRRIVVALDPSVTSGEKADEFGIIVAGLGTDGHGYVLEDATGRCPVSSTDKDNPGWVQVAIRLYRTWKADRVVAEVNNGGEMIEATLRMEDGSVSYSAVHATRGKVECRPNRLPICTKDLIHHVGSFPKLEDEMAGFTSDYDRSRDGSPNRVDALVWALTDLKIDPGGATGMLDYYRELAEAAKKDAGESPSTPANPSVSASKPAGGKSPEFVTLICPPANRGGIICGISRKEYTPDAMGMIKVDAEDARPLNAPASSRCRSRLRVWEVPSTTRWRRRGRKYNPNSLPRTGQPEHTSLSGRCVRAPPAHATVTRPHRYR